MTTVLLWLRRDFRLDDNPALSAAAALNLPVIPVFIWCPKEESPWEPGAASRWWLHQSLEVLAKKFQSLRSNLILRIARKGTLQELQTLIQQTKASHVFWNRLYDPSIVKRDELIKASLGKMGIEVKSFNSHLLYEPWTVATKEGKPYQVFTPFFNTATQTPPPAPVAEVSSLKQPATWPPSEPLEALELLPRNIRWDQKLSRFWTPGEKGAQVLAKKFLSAAVTTYKEARDFPSQPGTSKLSPHLHFGEISPKRLWAMASSHRKELSKKAHKDSLDWYLRELVWREFAHHVLFHFPKTSVEPLRSEFLKFPWDQNEKILSAWQRGHTGVPIVDAGMRELWETGWMHNRVRMIVASFLTKHLLHSWVDGARWFWETLVDADLPNNSLGWQWAGGCGADAAPYFRIFNPVLQAEKFDPDGVYVKRWAPEYSNLLPQNPIVDLKIGRDRALKAFESFRK